MISFDRSGLDICHFKRFKKIMENALNGKRGFQCFENLGTDLTIWKGNKRLIPNN